MSFVRMARRRFGIAGELLSFLWASKRWWMLPLIVVLLAAGVFLVVAQSSAIAPFIYTIF